MTNAPQGTDLSPAAFAVLVLGKRPYDWQGEALESIGMQLEGGPPTTLVAANGSGKTSDVVAPAIIWFLSRFPRGQVVVTSGSFRQIEKQLWPAMKMHRARFPRWEFYATEIRTGFDGFALGFSTDDPGRAEGWHPKVGPDVDPVMIVVDEAKTVPAGTFEAFDRCTRVIQLWASSPGAPRGQFYDSHHSRRSEFHAIKVSSDMCPHIDPAKVERDRRIYGEDHPIFRSMHLAEFTEDTNRLVLSPARLTRAIDGQPPQAATIGETVGFCDFAAGRDENVLAVRRGNHPRIVDSWRESDTMQGVRQFIRLFESEGLKAHQIWGDADGLGTVMCDALAEAGWRINRFHGGTPASDPAAYENLIAEVWHVGAREIEQGRIHLGDLDEVAFRQLTTRRSEWSERGRLRVESKEKMQAAGLRSPDRADALLGCIACGQRMTGTVTADRILLPASSDAGFGTPLVTGW